MSAKRTGRVNIIMKGFTLAAAAITAVEKYTLM